MSRKAVIAGAGPAGLTCGMYLAMAGWEVEVFSNEENTMSNLAEASLIRNYPGFPDGIQGFYLLELFKEQAVMNGVVIRPEGIVEADVQNMHIAIDTNGGRHEFDEFVIACGSRPRKFECKGIGLLPVHTCAVCDGSLYNCNSNVIVIGGGDTAVSSALYLSDIVHNVRLLVRKPQCRCTDRKALAELESRDNVDIMYSTTLEYVEKTMDGVPVVHVAQQGKYVDIMLMDVDAIFSCIGYDRNEITVHGECGNICGDYALGGGGQVATAVGSGAQVALRIIASVGSAVH